jgi:hypothetical protein
MRTILFTLTLAILMPLAALAQTAAPAEDAKARAEEVLKQARAAIWDSAKSKPLQSLTINANSRSVQGNRETSSEMTLDVLLPDKFLQTNVVTLGPPGMEITAIQAINGTQTWAEVKQPEGGFGGFGGDRGVFIGRGGGGPGGGPGGGGGNRGEGRGPGGGPGQFNPAGGASPDFARLLLSWLLITPATTPVEFTYAGEAKADGKTAHVIDATGPNNFQVRLFIDQSSQQLLMLTFKTRMPNFNRGQQGQNQGQNPGNRPPDANRGGGNQGGAGGNQENRQPPTPEELERMRAERERMMREAPEVEVRWIVSEYRNVNGLNLPHLLVKSRGGQITEQVEIKKVKINPSLKPEKFVKKEEKK